MSAQPSLGDGEDLERAAQAAATRAALLLAADLATRPDGIDGDDEHDDVQDSDKASSARRTTWTPLYPDAASWVAGMFAVTFVRRATPSFRWCAQWWRHPEAIVRLEALWRSWEDLRRDPTTGIGIWFRDYADHQLPILTGPGGPFADCDPGRHFEPEQSLPLQDPPPHWWAASSPSNLETGSTAQTSAARTPGTAAGDDVDMRDRGSDG